MLCIVFFPKLFKMIHSVLNNFLNVPKLNTEVSIVCILRDFLYFDQSNTVNATVLLVSEYLYTLVIILLYQISEELLRFTRDEIKMVAVIVVYETKPH